ncbi:MAG: hypothetical protein FKY71_09890 [Spiribacter salinus]|uniref:Uncharacterized protein n=1 Tax=Spiribacter salinus TaxID=1335746 RepID=A0A540VSR0_9GAMM|nr:MAG: hypothetical protein FKY71_09890 [Spiribacter salinus]
MTKKPENLGDRLGVIGGERKLVRSLRTTGQDSALVCVIIETGKEDAYYVVPLRGPDAMVDIGPYPTVEHAVFNANMIFGRELQLSFRVDMNELEGELLFEDAFAPKTLLKVCYKRNKIK